MLHVEKNKEKSEELYGKAITFAELLDDEVLVQRLLEEKKERFLATRRLSHVAFFIFMLD